MKKLIILSMAALTLTACSSTDLSSKISSVKEKASKVFTSNLKQDLNGREFKLVSEGYGRAVTIGFKDNRVFGNSGINRYFGTYEISGNKFNFSDFGLTRMGGSEDEMIKELKFLTNLKHNTAVKLEENVLTLTSEEGFIMEFRDVKATVNEIETSKKK